MVVGVRPPAKRTSPWRADRFSATAEADPGHGYGTEASSGSLRPEGGDCRSINGVVEGFGHRSGCLRLDVRNDRRLNDERASTDSVADVHS